MFHVNEKKLLLEEKEKGVAQVQYYEGVCMTCENSPDRENRAACPRADFFSVNAYISKFGNITHPIHLCKNWLLASEIANCFKRNISSGESQQQTTPQKNGFKQKQTKYMRD